MKMRVWLEPEKRMETIFGLRSDGELNHISTNPQFKAISMLDIGYPDCNDRDIFESDILKIRYEDPILGIEREVIGVVTIDTPLHIIIDFPQYGTGVSFSEVFSDDPDDYEILGNVYENYDIIEKLMEEEGE